MTNNFNVRVYGIVINENKQVLLSDEYIYGRQMTKFPGGGLQFGEGTVDCLKREFIEELGIDINVTGHFYTTDFFQPSYFNPKQQVISIYYFVSLKDASLLKVSDKAMDFPEITEGSQAMRWLPLGESSETDVTFPIDKKVLGLLKNHFNV